MPTGGIENAGWAAEFNDKPLHMTGRRGTVGDVYSIGLLLDGDGAVTDSIVGSPAFEAGISPGMKVVGVNGRVYTHDLLEDAIKAAKDTTGPITLLVVDDEAISRRAVTYALDKARLKSTSVEDPAVALELLSETKFDLVILDVDMPGMNGFELCTKLRALPEHRKTPVVFVTCLNDFDNRANSTMSGGNDFIAKPFLFIELAVKALVYVLRSRLQAGK